ncbi:MAG: tyrosine-type recombinase/integrase, partial [Polyangiales bacterium]
GGLRQGEVRGLEVRDVDFVHDRLLVRRALSENTEVTPKSGNDRVVPLAAELREVLEKVVRSKLPRARVVVFDSGETPSRQRFLGLFKALLRKHGLKERSFHSLRHYFCTTLLRRGASIEAVRVRAGHTNQQVPQRDVHAAAGDLRAAIAMLGGTR